MTIRLVWDANDPSNPPPIKPESLLPAELSFGSDEWVWAASREILGQQAIMNNVILATSKKGEKPLTMTLIGHHAVLFVSIIDGTFTSIWWVCPKFEPAVGQLKDLNSPFLNRAAEYASKARIPGHEPYFPIGADWRQVDFRPILDRISKEVAQHHQSS